MINGKSHHNIQELFEPPNEGRVHTLATPLERAAAEVGVSPWWLKQWLTRCGSSLESFVAGNQFKALKQRRAAAFEEATRPLLSCPRAIPRQERSAAPQPARPRSRTNGVTPAATAAVPDRKTIGKMRDRRRHDADAAMKSQENSPRQVAHG
jgi:hypothetical protein